MSALICLALLSLGATPPAEVTWDRNQGSAATAAFGFERVPSPASDDAATDATFTVLGRSDDNGGDVDVLNDGIRPGRADDPGANFFFAQNAPGGRIVVDLGQVAEVRGVNTYSWHPSDRGPQVYRLYASDGRAEGFNARPEAGAALNDAGWREIAAVDTRPKEGQPGGQYGVSIAGPEGRPLGRFRYLLFDIQRTESRDPFGNTFFSEIDVLDGQKHAARPRPAQQIVIDTSECPDLSDWAEKRLRPACETWYPKIVAMLSSEGYVAPRRMTIVFRKDMDGVAHTGGKRVECAARWFRANLEGEAVGAVIHELVHVAQQYPRSRTNPVWLVEGTADYIRWFQFEPIRQRPRPNPARAHYTDSYRTTAAFLDYVVRKHDPKLIEKLNAAMREDRYRPELWKTWTGKSIEELWSEYVATLKASS